LLWLLGEVSVTADIPKPDWLVWRQSAPAARRCSRPTRRRLALAFFAARDLTGHSMTGSGQNPRLLGNPSGAGSSSTSPVMTKQNERRVDREPDT
jgi:hypothetical protein